MAAAPPRSRSGPPPPPGDTFDAEVVAPALRHDLVLVARDNGKVLVKRRDTSSVFSIAWNVWTIAQLLDGARTFASVAAAASRMGVSTTAEMVVTVVAELHGYGFLASQKRDRERSPLRAGLEPAPGPLPTAAGVDDGTPDSAVEEHLDAVLQANVAYDSPFEATTAERLRFAFESADTDLENALPAPPRGRSRSRMVLWFAIAAIVVVLGFVLYSNYQIEAKLASLQPQQLPTRVAPVAHDGRDAPSAPVVDTKPTPTVVAQPAVEATRTEAIVAPADGVWTESFVEVGAQVDAGTVIGTTLSARDHVRYAKARRRYQKIASSARADEVYKYFVTRARADFEAATRSLPRTKVIAVSAGKVTVLSVKPGMPVTANQAVAEVTTGASAQ